MQIASCSSASAVRGGQAARLQRRSRSSLPCRAAAAPVQEVLEEGSRYFRTDVPAGLNKYSGKITQPKSQGASQAMLYATGLTEADMNKPQVKNAGFAAGEDDWRGVVLVACRVLPVGLAGHTSRCPTAVINQPAISESIGPNPAD